MDAVASNAGISFMSDLTPDAAAAWWREILTTASSRDHRYTLLVLDTCKGGAAEQLYTSLGWVRIGEVPNFALNPDGSWCDTVFFYKQLSPILNPEEREG